MRNNSKLILLGLLVLLCFASCASTKVRYLGYTYWGGTNPKVDYAAWGHDDSRGNQTLSPVDPSVHMQGDGRGASPSSVNRNPYIGSRFMSHDHRLLRDYRYAVFCPEGYASERDINYLVATLRVVSERTLIRMLLPMAEGEFEYYGYSKKYRRILSDGVRDCVMSKKMKEKFPDLGGWQMFKPHQGLEKQGKSNRYSVSYNGDGWYEVYDPFSNDTPVVCVKMAYSGKMFNSIVLGVRNEKFGVDIHDANYSYSHKDKLLTFTEEDDGFYTYRVVKFLAPKVYKMIGEKNLMTEEDFDIATKQIVAKEKAFVHEFYDKLRGFGNDMRKIIKTYRYQMVQHFAGSIDEQIKKKDYGVDLFLPCSFGDFAANGYTVNYMGEDCFKVTAGGKSLYLKVVLYGNNLTPAIMGVKNPAQGVDYCPYRFPWAETVK